MAEPMGNVMLVTPIFYIQSMILLVVTNVELLVLRRDELQKLDKQISGF